MRVARWVGGRSAGRRASPRALGRPRIARARRARPRALPPGAAWLRAAALGVTAERASPARHVAIQALTRRPQPALATLPRRHDLGQLVAAIVIEGGGLGSVR